MSRRERVLIYPYDYEMTPVIRHCELVQDYEITRLISPKGWGLHGKDAGTADGGYSLGITVESNFESNLAHCDTVWFTESTKYLDYEEYVAPKINSSIKAGKNIITTAHFQEEILNEIREKCKAKGTVLRSFPTPEEDIELKSSSLYKINTPIVLIAGIAERTNKFELQLSIRDYFLQKGYRVSQVGSRSYSELFGFHSMPDFMYAGTLNRSEVTKVFLFNQYIKNIEVTERPDVIIIGIPGGTMAYNAQHSNGFGILAFEIAQAIQPDAVVYSILYEKYTTEYFEKIANFAEYRFGFEIDLFNLTNQRLDLVESDFVKRLVYLTVDSKFIDKQKHEFSKEIRWPICNVLNQEDSKTIPMRLEEILMEYGEVESF